jgi:hypothetical protein
MPPYTHSPAMALNGEPEAVDGDTQTLLTRESGDRELRTWRSDRQRILDALAHLEAHVKSPHMPRMVRAVRRELDALDHKLV